MDYRTKDGVIVQTRAFIQRIPPTGTGYISCYSRDSTMIFLSTKNLRVKNHRNQLRVENNKLTDATLSMSSLISYGF